jgi:nucleoside 2-deoxyribosyltransferase
MRYKGLIYLAGPMAGMTWCEAYAWRARVGNELSPWWDTVSPLQGTTMIPEPGRPTEHVSLIHTATGLTTKDEYYIRKCDFILANFLGADRGSLGTAAEIGFGYALGKQIISVMAPEGDPNDHAFTRRWSHIFVPTLEEAIEYLKEIAI